MRKFALQNAVKYEGKANPGAIIGKVLGEMPEYREKGKEIMKDINAVVKEVNSMSVDEQTKELKDIAPELLEKKETEKKVVDIWTKCPFWERAKEFGVTAKYDCVPGCSTWTEKGLEVINPKLMVKITKALPRGDPYCEFIYELKE